MRKPNIDIGSKHADVAGQCIYRPASMSASEWISFWEAVRETDFDENNAIRKKLGEALDEIKILEDVVRDLRDELRAKGDY